LLFPTSNFPPHRAGATSGKLLASLNVIGRRGADSPEGEAGRGDHQTWGIGRYVTDPAYPA
jgi:hypothetical protein